MEYNKYGQRTATESAAIWIQEVALVGVVLFLVVFAVGVTFDRQSNILSEQARLQLQSERTGSLLNSKAPMEGQEAH
jgi:hypothetical protein